MRHRSGPCEIIAGPGSGKTTVLVCRVKYLAEVYGVDPSRILVLTFTRAAAQVMRERSFRIFDRSEEVTFSTFHALFLRILSSLRFRYRIISEQQRARFLKLRLEDHFPEASLRPDVEDLSAWLTGQLSSKEISKESSKEIQKEIPGTIPEEISGKTLEERRPADTGQGEDPEEPEFSSILQEYHRYLRENRLLDLDEAAGLCTKLLREDPAGLRRWRGRWDHIFVDEFQDINPAQYELVRLLAEGTGNLCVVGDDDQSIYGFRGSSPVFMFRFFKDYPEAARYYLTENHRSSPGIVAVSSAVIGENRGRIPKLLHSASRPPLKLRTALADRTDVRILGAQDDRSQQLLLVRSFREQLSGRKLSSAALITRTHRQLHRWEHVLETAGIPVYYAAENDRTEDRVAAGLLSDLNAYAQAAAQIRTGVPRAVLLRIMNRPDRGLGRELLPDSLCTRQDMLDSCRWRAGTERTLRQFLDDLDILRGLPPVFFLRYLFGTMGYLADRVQREPAVRTQLTVLSRQIMEKAEQSSCREISGFLSGLSLPTEKKPVRKEEALLELCTMHACKGREFDLVLLPDLNEGIIPSRRSLDPGDLEEERRLLYVAMTRAGRQLFLFYVEGTEQNRRTPSRFLRPLGIRPFPGRDRS